LNEGKFIHFTNKSTTNYLILDFSVFYQDKPCFYSQDYFWETFMPLEIGKGSPGCKKSKEKTDERFIFLDKYNLSLFYDENYFYDFYDLENIIPEKKKTFYNSNINLFYRNYIGLNYTLLNKSKIHKFWNLSYGISNFKNSKEEERLFFSRVSNKLNRYIFDNVGYVPFFLSFAGLILASIFKNLISPSCTKDIILYIFIPEFLLAGFIIWELSKLKKRNLNEILNDVYNICDENTKFGLDFIKKERFDITSIRSLNLFGLALLIAVIIALFILLIKLLKYCLDRYIINCERDEDKLLLEEENTEIKKIKELRDIN